VAARSGGKDVSDSDTGQKESGPWQKSKKCGQIQRQLVSTPTVGAHYMRVRGALLNSTHVRAKFGPVCVEKGAVHNASTCSGAKEAGKGKQGHVKPGNKDNQACYAQEHSPRLYSVALSCARCLRAFPQPLEDENARI